jgi:hypothetical protein
MLRRVALRLAVCLVLGVVSSIAVAWGFKLNYWWFSSPSTSFTARDGDRWFNVLAWLAPGRRSYTVIPDPASARAYPTRVDCERVVRQYIQDVQHAEYHLANGYILNLISTIFEPADLAAAVDGLPGLADEFGAATDLLARQAGFERTADRVRQVYRRGKAASRAVGLGRRSAVLPGWVRRSAPDGVISQLATGAYGWPLVCLKSELETYSAGSTQREVYKGGIVIDRNWRPSPGNMICSLPLMPVCGGLAIDAAAHGAVWAGVLLVAPAVRRRRRLRSGLCPVCRYDLRADYIGGCPECGWGRRIPVNNPVPRAGT